MSEQLITRCKLMFLPKLANWRTLYVRRKHYKVLMTYFLHINNFILIYSYIEYERCLHKSILKSKVKRKLQLVTETSQGGLETFSTNGAKTIE